VIQTIGASLILAAISGLSYLAYKHPKAYSRLYIPLCLIGVIALALIGIWDTALSVAQEHLKQSLPAEQSEISKAVLSGLTVSFGWTMLCAFVYILIIAVLLFLPNLLEEDKKHE
jgi:UDP-N-acetylmuramyl pentapeptide phosphotransferase/UDP-N-acetylglucosamine-1-phosphate transferase